MREEADALAEMARNRGYRLVRSRVRTPTKRAFGKYGLEDAKGSPVLGLEGKHPSASAEEVETFLRKGLVSDWAQSLGVDPPKVRKPRKAPPSSPPPPPKPNVRPATARDVAALAALIALLGHEVDAATVRKQLKAVAVPQLVATLGKEVVGLCGLDVEHHIHRPQPVGRITILVVSETARGQGIGRMLVSAAEAALGKAGCTLIEVTSNERLVEAHRFYGHLGYEHTSKRFAKRA